MIFFLSLLIYLINTFFCACFYFSLYKKSFYQKFKTVLLSKILGIIIATFCGLLFILDVWDIFFETFPFVFIFITGFVLLSIIFSPLVDFFCIRSLATILVILSIIQLKEVNSFIIPLFFQISIAVFLYTFIIILSYILLKPYRIFDLLDDFINREKHARIKISSYFLLHQFLFFFTLVIALK